MINIRKNVKLADYSTFKIGGGAREFVEVKSEGELLEALDYARKNNLKLFILGDGSNVLFDDKGFNGLIIKMSAQREPVLGWRNTFLECWAGNTLSSLVDLAGNSGLSGLEWAAGIPGTVGGAIRGNAGAFGGAISDVVAEMRVFDTTKQRIENYDSGNCNFGYRDSIFKRNQDLVIISAKLNLKRGKREKVEGKMKEIFKKRSVRQPKSWVGSVGSFFKNPIVEDEKIKKDFESETGNKAVENVIPAGWLIEEVELKGKKIGNISISDANANFLINEGGGTMEEVLIVVSIIKQRVRNKFGIELQEEVKVVYC